MYKSPQFENLRGWSGAQRRCGLLLLLGLALSSLLPSVVLARTIDEAVEQLAESLGRQLQSQQVSNLTILQFTNLSGGQTRLEENLADGLARAVSAKTSLAFIDRLRAEQLARRFALPVGAQIYGETAARIGKGVGADAVITGTIEEIGSGRYRLQAQAFSSQRGQNIASAETSADGGEATVVAPRQPTPLPMRPERVEPRAPAASAGPSAMVHGLRMQVRYCELSPSRTASCHMTVMSESQDRELTLLDGYTKLQDDTAKSYPAKVSFGRDAMSGQKKSVLIADTTYEVTLHAENFSTQASRVIAVQVDRMDVRQANGGFIGYVKHIFPNPPTQNVAFSVAPALPSGGPRESNGFIFDVQSCEVASTRTMSCHLKVTSRGVSRKLTLLDRYVRLQDDTSRAYPAELGWGMDPRGGQNDMVLIPDTPYDLTMIAENVSSQTTRVRAIVIERMDARQAQGAFIGYIKMALGHPPAR